MYKLFSVVVLILFPIFAMADNSQAIEFAKICVQLDQVKSNLSKDGNKRYVTCQTKDGGRVGIAVQYNEGIFGIHQTTQMEAKVINAFADAINLTSYLGDTKSNPSFYFEGDAITPATEKERYKCAEKFQHARDSGNYGDMTIKFSLNQPYVVSCVDH